MDVGGSCRRACYAVLCRHGTDLVRLHPVDGRMNNGRERRGPDKDAMVEERESRTKWGEALTRGLLLTVTQPVLLLFCVRERVRVRSFASQPKPDESACPQHRDLLTKLIVKT